MRGTMTSWMRWSPSSMTAWIICSSSASRMPCSPPCSMIRRSSSELIRSSAATSAPNSRLIRRVVQVRNATSGPNSVPRTSMSRLVDIATRSAWARPICLGTSSPKMIVKRVRRTVTTTSAIAFAASGERPECRQPGGHAVDEADRREGRGQEAQEVDADLDDGQEAARVALRRWTAGGAAVALVDELLDPAAPERDERDLGGREDAVEQDEDDDERELEDGAAHEGASPRCGFRRGARRPPRRLRSRHPSRVSPWLADARRDADRQLAGRARPG